MNQGTKKRTTEDPNRNAWSDMASGNACSEGEKPFPGIVSEETVSGGGKPFPGKYVRACLPWIRRAGAVALDLLYPPRCAVCDGLLRKGEDGCCADCRAALPWVREPACMKCGKPVADFRQEYCDDCARTRHFFARGVAAFTYTGAMRQSVHRLKSGNRRDALDFYAAAMVQALEPHLAAWQPQMLIPVPMYRRKQVQRGYNQAELLARRIGGRVGIPVETGLVRCTRRHAPQKTLGREARMRNLRGCFAVTRRIETGCRLLLVDDVYTTGSTVDELARVLREAGAGAVYFLVLCTGKGKKTVCTAENVCYTKIPDR